MEITSKETLWETSHSLYCFQEGVPPSDKSVQVIQPAFHVNNYFTENASFSIMKPCSEALNLFIDDEKIEVENSEHGDVWVWSPGFYAGEVTAVISDSENKEAAVYLLDVSPHKNKLGREIYNSIVDDLWNFDPVLVIGQEPSTTIIGSEDDYSDPLLQFYRMRKYYRAFYKSLLRICENPMRKLEGIRDSIPLHKVRRVDSKSSLSIFRNAELLGIFFDAANLQKAGMPSLNVPVVNDTYDCSANRCIYAVVKKIIRRAVALVDDLEKLALNTESDTRTSMVNRIGVRKQILRKISSELTVLLKNSFFNMLSDCEISAEGLNAVSAHPLYSRAFGLAWRMLRYGVGSPQDEDRLWMSPTWELYERWCFVKIVEQCKKKYTGLVWEEKRGTNSKYDYCVTGTSESGECVNIMMQCRFQSFDNKKDDLYSISGFRIPDIVVAGEFKGKSIFHIYDAKYRSGRENVLDAMSSAHLYHDSLRYKDQKPEKALLLTPSSSGVSFLEDVEFQNKHGVGVVILSPD